MDAAVGRSSADMMSALVELDRALQGGPFPLELADVVSQRRARDEMRDQITDYLLPRLAELEAPLLVVVGGSTGVGKSTLVSSLVGELVTDPGVLRPTTRSPVLVHHPDDGAWFVSDRIFPRLPRDASPDPGEVSLHLAATPQVPAGLALIDAPDFDSVEESNRFLATELLAAADLWLFVTSAARYADGVPWDHLRMAVDRGTVVAIVLNRVPERGGAKVERHLRSLMQTRGLGDSPLFVIFEGALDGGLLPEHALADARAWLETIAGDPAERQTVLDQTLDGAIRALARRSYGLAGPLQDQAEALETLRDAVALAYDDEAAQMRTALGDGSLLRGETRLRWQELVAAGALQREMPAKPGSWRNRLAAWSKGARHKPEAVSGAIAVGLQTLLVEAAESAAERSASAWFASEIGRPLLERDPALWRASTLLRVAAAQLVESWQAGLTAALRKDLGPMDGSGASPVEAEVAGVAAMVLALGDGGAAAAVAQEFLAGFTTADQARATVATARAELEVSMAALLGEDRQRFEDMLAGLGLNPQAAGRLREASARLDQVRFASQLEAGIGSAVEATL